MHNRPEPANPAQPSAGLQTALTFPLIEALIGRRSRRFALGASLPDGPLAYTSTQAPLPLSEEEQLLLLAAMTGNTGWHYLLPRQRPEFPQIANYAAAAGGRTFPSAAGWHTTELFYTDDAGVYFFATRDVPALIEPDAQGQVDLAAWLAAHRSCIRKLADTRLALPPSAMDGHNGWCANAPGSTLLIPVADLAQHLIAVLCFMVQNGSCLYDNLHDTPIAGLAAFRHLVDVDHPAPLSEIEQNCLTMGMAELSTACYAGNLLLQAVGLGGWMFTGLDAYTVLGCSRSATPSVPGLGFHYEQNPAWTTPNPTGLPGVFEGFCPPHYPDMRAAVDAFIARKFGPGGPFHAETPGPWQANARVRTSAPIHSEEFAACVTVMAHYIYDRFGRFPATIPSIFARIFLQAHHLDLGFYDTHFAPGAYLHTHAEHMANWHAS
ncbi:MAG: hypothetical protein KF832_28085 [Caldilineaceae bacterium]|nr:hypothetical protein [Caldilineaceae bacterium]